MSRQCGTRVDLLKASTEIRSSRIIQRTANIPHSCTIGKLSGHQVVDRHLTWCEARALRFFTSLLSVDFLHVPLYQKVRREVSFFILAPVSTSKKSPIHGSEVCEALRQRSHRTVREGDMHGCNLL